MTWEGQNYLESVRDNFEVNDFKSAENSEEEVKYTLKLMLDKGLVFDETTRYDVVQVGQLTWMGQNYYEDKGHQTMCERLFL